MKDEHPHLVAECARCGFRFDILLGVDCPRCRRVTDSFRPRNPEAYENLDFLREKLAQQGVRWHGPENPYKHTCMHPGVEDCKACDWFNENKHSPPEDSTEVPEGCKIPLGEQAQVYELRRMFRL